MNKSAAVRPGFLGTALIFGAVGLLFVLPHGIGLDGSVRLKMLGAFLTEGRLTDDLYSMIGPLFATPLWLLGLCVKTSEFWCIYYNTILFSVSIVLLYVMLRNRMDRAVLRTFLLLLASASLYTNYANGFNGEMFTSLSISLGLLAVCLYGSAACWIPVVLGTVNTPGTIVGLAFAVIKKCFDDRRIRYSLVILAAVILFFTENYLRRGSPFVTGYEGKGGYKTVLPYSGLPGMAYPLFFGLLSTLFSFGKGLIFFAPGLVLPVKRHLKDQTDLWKAYELWLFFVAGLVLTYCRWHAWYGGWTFGPRYLLAAAVPASFALALNYHCARSLKSMILTFCLLTLSCWVGLSGAVYMQANMRICAENKYALEALCWYVPEFSALWRPFVVPKALTEKEILSVCFYVAVYICLAAPLVKRIYDRTKYIIENDGRHIFSRSDWRF